jgi:hypothetical protein
MAPEDKEAFLSRWSRLKQEQAREAPARAAPAPGAAQETQAPTLPPVDELTPKSDFAPFMQPKVGEAVRRVALKKLFSDPHFNVPDLFEPYSGDWTGGDPISEELLKTLNQARTVLFREEEAAKEKEAAARESAQGNEAGAQADGSHLQKEEDGTGRQDT